MQLVFSLLIIFVCGLNFGMNISDLVPCTPAWQAAWWKVWVSLGIAVVFSIKTLKGR